MTETTEPTTKVIRNPGAAPRIEVRISSADSGEEGKAPTVCVRCDACNRRHYDLEIGRVVQGLFGSKVEDGTLIVRRKCPTCRGINEGRVTAADGYPLQTPDALRGPWRCTHCGRSLGKIDPNRSRITTTCRCSHETRADAAAAIMVAHGIPYEEARKLRD